MLKFTDMSRDRVTVQVSGGGAVEAWRELNGDVEQLRIVGAVPNRTTLTGSVRPAIGSTGLVVIPSIQGLTGVIDQLTEPLLRDAGLRGPIPDAGRGHPSELALLAQDRRRLPALGAFDPVGRRTLKRAASGSSLAAGPMACTVSTRTDLPISRPCSRTTTSIVIDPATGQTWTAPWSTTGSARLGDRLAVGVEPGIHEQVATASTPSAATRTTASRASSRPMTRSPRSASAA